MKLTLTDRKPDVLKTKPRALITGAEGFTGTHLAAALEAQGYEVFGTTLRPTTKKPNMASVDILDLQAVRGVVDSVKPEVVAHLAAIASVDHSDPRELYLTNLIGSRNVLEAVSLAGLAPKAVLLASSAQVYGSNLGEISTESTNLKPLSDYAVSKLAMEFLAFGKYSALPVMVVRPFNYTGRGQSDKFIIGKLVNHFRDRAEEIELGNVDIERDFSDVRVVVWAYVQLLLNPQPGQIYNVSSGVATKLRDVIATLEELAGYKIKLAQVQQLTRAAEIPRLSGDSSKLWAHIGKPPEYSLKETLSWMLKD